MTWIGLSLYWLATPLKTTKSGAGLPAAALGSEAGSFCPARYHSLWTRATSWSTFGSPPFGSTMTMPNMPFAMWCKRRGRAAVVHPDARVVGREGVGEGGAGLDLDHLVVHRRLAGVEVDRVRHLGLVRQVNADGVAEVDPDGRAGHLSAERPGVDDEAVGHRDVLVDDRQVDVVDRAGQDCWRHGVTKGVGRRVWIRDRRRCGFGGLRGWLAGGEAVAPATVIDPFIPASAWPGMEHRKVIPPAGTVTLPLTVAPASAAIFVPSAKVRSWSVEPVLWKVTS